jgi:hypothetical protein
VGPYFTGLTGGAAFVHQLIQGGIGAASYLIHLMFAWDCQPSSDGMGCQ